MSKDGSFQKHSRGPGIIPNADEITGSRKISPRQMFEKQGFFKSNFELDEQSFYKEKNMSVNLQNPEALLNQSRELLYELKPCFNSSISDRSKFNYLTETDEGETSLQNKFTIEEDEVKEDIDGSSVFADFESWLLQNGATFPELFLKSYSPDVRGVHAKQYVDSYQTIVSIPLKCLITDHMGRTQIELGRRVFNSNANLSTPNLIAVILYILTTRKDMNNFFQPYYRVLPKSFSNFPIFWSQAELKYLEGSPILDDLAERKINMRSDYDELCRVVEFPYTFEEFLEVRTAVGSRNFGIVVNGEKRTAMVPFADMLNHYRPRETSWTYENQKSAFTITSITPLQPGQQVMDSYGKKCNSKFFLHYGFAVENNREEDGKSQNEINLPFNVETNLFYLNGTLQQMDEESKSKDELVEKKMAVLRHLFNVSVHRAATVCKNFRVSMNFEDKATSDALGFLRVKTADEKEINSLISFQKLTHKHLSSIYFSRSRDILVEPISPQSEAKCLKEMASICTEQLSNYPSSYEENKRKLESSTLKPFSNEKTALILIVGEQEICDFWNYAAEILVPILMLQTRMEIVRALSTLPRSNHRERDLWRYAAYLSERFRA